MASKYETQDEEYEQQGLVASTTTTLLRPIHLLLSTPARRAYLTTILALSTSLLLLLTATTAYTLFYNAYIPRLSFSRPIHLQFDDIYPPFDSHGHHVPSYPHGTVKLAPEIVSAQHYDVYIHLSLPRTPENCAAGNFMLEASMRAAGSVMDTLTHNLAPKPLDSSQNNLLATSRRSAILPYRSPIVDSLYKLMQLHWYLLNWRHEAETLTVHIFESVEFSRGWRNLPDIMRVEVQSPSRLQIYSAEAVFQARFQGLRWWMYNHRILSAVVWVSAFWTTEMLFAGLGWVVAARVSNGNPAPQTTKTVGSRCCQIPNAPFLRESRQPALRYESPAIKPDPDVKQEYEDEDTVLLPSVPPQRNGTRATEADDEDEEEDEGFRDSGLGTSMESSAATMGRGDSVRRRRAMRMGSGDGGK